MNKHYSSNAKKKTKRRKAHYYGIYAEFLTCLYLLLSGYRIISRRYKTNVGEIDIIVRKQSTIVFIEVKARKSALHDEVISAQQRRRITNAASLFIANHSDFARYDVRFDAIIVRPWKLPEHIEHAWIST